MALDEGISNLIGDIYASAVDSVAWDRAIRNLVARTESRFSLVTVVDTSVGGFSSTRWFGEDSGRFDDGVREYNEHFFRDDPTLRYGLSYPNAGSVRLFDTLFPSSEDFRGNPFVRWNEDVMGAGDVQVRYTPPVNGLILAVSLGAKAENRVHGDSAQALFGMMFGHIRTALELSIRPPDFASQIDARILLDRSGRVLAVSPAAEAILARCDGLLIARRILLALRTADSQRIMKLDASKNRLISA